MRRLPRLACLLVSTVTVSVAVAVGSSEPAHAAPVETFDSRSGPLGAVTVIGDSILMGAALYSPTLPARLVEQGWGPVRLRAGEGYSTGQFGVELSFRSSYWIAQWRAEGWDPPNVIVNLGANDSGFCGLDLACARERDHAPRRRHRSRAQDLVAADHPPVHASGTAGHLEPGAATDRRRARRLLHVGLADRDGVRPVPVERRYAPRARRVPAALATDGRGVHRRHRGGDPRRR